MKIAYVTNANARSGVGLRAAKMIHALRARGVKATLFRLDGEKGILLKDEDVIEKIGRWPGVLGAKTITWARMRGVLREHVAAYEVVHFSNQTLSFLGAKQKTVVTVHDLIELTDPQSWAGSLLARWQYSGIRKADALVSVSKFTAAELRRIYPSLQAPITIAHNGVADPYVFVPGFDESTAAQEWRRRLEISATTKVILYVGSDHPRKNVRGALAAYQGVREDVPDSVFLKVGRAGLVSGRGRTMSAVSELGIINNVRFVEEVSDVELAELYNLADVLLYPSTHEGFGLPPLQAMACGTPVVTSDIAPIQEVTGHATLQCDPHNGPCLSASLLEVLQDPHMAITLRAQGVERAERFNWDSAAAQVQRVYESLI